MGLPPRAESQPRKAPQTNLPMKLSVERFAAAAARMHVRVLNLESRPLQAVHVINLTALEEVHAHRIDDYLDTVLRDDLILGLLVIKRHPVLHARAATR